MRPLQLAQSLKRIASGIESSKNPKKELIIRDLKKVLIAMDESDQSKMREIRSWIDSLNAEAQLAESKLNLGEGEELDKLYWKFDQIRTVEKKGGFDYDAWKKVRYLIENDR